jgi:nucleotide-binding universal stress UspA family protein
LVTGFPTILCPVDFSDQSRPALQYAVRVAQHFRSGLTVLNVMDPMLVAAAAVHQTNLEAETRKELLEFITAAVPDLKARIGEVKVLAKMGSAEREILHVAQEEHADLIVLGTHGLSGYKKAFFGSVTERVLRNTTIPVLTVPPLGTEILVPADRLAESMDRILAPVDFSDASMHSARVAAGLAKALEAELILVHAVAPISAIASWSENARTQEQARVTEAGNRLHALAASLNGAIPPRPVVQVGNPADVIAKVTEEERARLIVIGLHGSAGLLGPAPGSVTYRVLTVVPVPVLALPAPNPSTRALLHE